MNHRSTHTRKDNDRLLTSTRFLEKAKNREMMASIKGKTMAALLTSTRFSEGGKNREMVASFSHTVLENSVVTFASFLLAYMILVCRR